MGELALLTLVALPVGGLFGYSLSAAIVGMIDSEVYASRCRFRARLWRCRSWASLPRPFSRDWWSGGSSITGSGRSPQDPRVARRLCDFSNTSLIAGVVIVLAIVAMAMWPESIEVNAAKVERGPMQVTLDEDGPKPAFAKFVVSAPVAGRLQRIELEPGDTVVRGKTVVARLTTADAPLLDPRMRGELEQRGGCACRGRAGTCRFERTTAELARARQTLQRRQELMKAGAIAADSLEMAETAVATAEEARKAAEFAVSRSEYEMQTARARLQAPAPAGRASDGRRSAASSSSGCVKARRSCRR